MLKGSCFIRNVLSLCASTGDGVECIQRLGPWVSTEVATACGLLKSTYDPICDTEDTKLVSQHGSQMNSRILMTSADVSPNHTADGIARCAASGSSPCHPWAMTQSWSRFRGARTRSCHTPSSPEMLRGSLSPGANANQRFWPCVICCFVGKVRHDS